MTAYNLVRSFFREHLVQERGLAPNTIAAYSQGVKQLLAFAAAKQAVEFHRLDLAAFTADLVCEYLDRVEADHSIATRNLRLSAVRALFKYMGRQDPCMLAAAASICNLTSKKTPEPVMPHLCEEEVRGFMTQAAASRHPLMRLRNQALFQILYNTGARASEIVGLNCDSVTYGEMPDVSLQGKGGKTHPVPLWPETAEAIKLYLAYRREQGIDHEALFLNPQRQRLSRFGLRNLVQRSARHVASSQPTLDAKHVTTHTFRHTTAFHMLRVTQDLTAVQDWLGHRDINTTSRYCRTDPETKRQALTTFRPPDTPPPHPLWKAPDIMILLEQLARSPQSVTLCEVKPRFHHPFRAQVVQNFT